MLRTIYLILAVIGAVLPMFYFVRWFNEFGWSLSAMVEAWNVNDATTGLVYDLTVAAVAITVAIVVDAVRGRDWASLVCVPVTFGIGVSCGVPLYLWFRERRRERGA